MGYLETNLFASQAICPNSMRELPLNDKAIGYDPELILKMVCYSRAVYIFPITIRIGLFCVGYFSLAVATFKSAELGQ